MNIGIFGGSFNPIHNGHIHVAEAALAQALLDQVWMMVSPQNPLKTHEQLPHALRYHLTRIALHGYDSIFASAFEASLPTPSYTWHTLLSLKQRWPQHQFSLIIGQDNLQNFHKWYHWQDILANHQLIVYPREDNNSPSNFPFASSSHPQWLQGRFVNISSTEIRQRILSKEDISNLTPSIVQPLLTLLYK